MPSPTMVPRCDHSHTSEQGYSRGGGYLAEPKAGIVERAAAPANIATPTRFIVMTMTLIEI